MGYVPVTDSSAITQLIESLRQIGGEDLSLDCE
jgi:hypothetical protein